MYEFHSRLMHIIENSHIYWYLWDDKNQRMDCFLVIFDCYTWITSWTERWWNSKLSLSSWYQQNELFEIPPVLYVQSDYKKSYCWCYIESRSKWESDVILSFLQAILSVAMEQLLWFWFNQFIVFSKSHGYFLAGSVISSSLRTRHKRSCWHFELRQRILCRLSGQEIYF